MQKRPRQKYTPGVSPQGSHVCRTCLASVARRDQQKKLFNIHTMDLKIRQWLQDSTLENPAIEDKYPTFVCHSCHDTLQNFLNFYQMSLRSRQKFDEMLEMKSTNKDEINKDWFAFDWVSDTQSELNNVEQSTGTAKHEDAEEEEEVSNSESIGKTDDIPKDDTNDKIDITHLKKESDSNDPEYQDTISESEKSICDISSDDERPLIVRFPKKTILKTHDSCKEKKKPPSTRQRKLKTSDEKTQHVCEECGKVYKSLVKLIEHQYSHKPLEEYPFHCDEESCGKAFKNKSSYQEHKLRHAGVKNFKCHLCDMKKTTKKELDIHINYHTKERQWLCPKCSMIFYSSNDLRSHDRIVHLRIRRFFCRFCDQAFAKNYALKHHEMRHTGKKPHVCSECGKGFIQMVSLRTHMKTHKSLVENLTKTKIIKDNKG
ncbi:uncharacterized protein LOC142231881 isoform X2 [Haematobia irritans]|uniref:uncharacterized protein LOC142231881 isoform X2 n=1 Tax=Haematobia irritans TaxID=7368 RepID=UPI003F5092F8